MLLTFYFALCYNHHDYKEMEKLMKYEELSAKPDFCNFQQDIIDFWKDNQVFERSVDQRTEKENVFYDGPPFPTGKPHHGTVLVSFIKDMLARYWTMRGYKVPRVWGWDCHGLPIENQAESLLGINDKNEIEISVDGYVFVPDLQFMNEHAVCRYCGQIYIWDYEG